MVKISKKFKIVSLAFSVVLGFVVPNTLLAAGPASVNLGSAGNFVIVAKTGISTTGATSVVGNLGLSPAAATYITGFGLTMDSSNTFANSSLVTGKIYAVDYTVPTPTTMTTAVSDMETAYVDAVGRTNPTATELGAGNIGGMTLSPGLYKWGTGLTIPSNVTLSGGESDVWIFQIAQNLDVSSGVQVILAGGAKAENIFWQVAGQATIGTTAIFNGNILSQTAIVLNTGARLNGRALAQTAVTLDANMVVFPASTVPVVPPVVPPVSTPPTVCAMDVMQCPDGSYVSRQAPSCAFASCPVTTYVPPTSGGGSTTENAALQAQINSLLVTLRALQARVGQGGSAPASGFGQQVRTIAISLGKGSRGNEVAILQQFLISQNKGPAAQTLAGVGATAYFGEMTRAALAEFQAKVGIGPALGNFGPITRAHLNANY